MINSHTNEHEDSWVENYPVCTVIDLYFCVCNINMTLLIKMDLMYKMYIYTLLGNSSNDLGRNEYLPSQ